MIKDLKKKKKANIQTRYRHQIFQYWEIRTICIYNILFIYIDKFVENINSEPVMNMIVYQYYKYLKTHKYYNINSNKIRVININ